MAASILLCAEDSSSILGFGDEEETQSAAGAKTTSGSPYCGGSGTFAAVDFPLPSEECVARCVATDAEHIPREDYAERLRAGGVDLRVRTDAVDWIRKVHSYYSFGPQLPRPLPRALPASAWERDAKGRCGFVWFRLGITLCRVPPPHLSPFVDNEKEGYVPERAEAIKKMQAAQIQVPPLPCMVTMD